MEQKPPRKLLDQVSDAIRLKHYAYRTEQTYKDRIKRFILFHHKRHPNDMGAPKSKPLLPTSPSKKTSPPPPRIKPSPLSSSYTATPSR
jgi:hypothetical protein|nr:phage integrase N-terminal SAM-like domain-containing protein [Roseiflexus castenholzii]